MNNVDGTKGAEAREIMLTDLIWKVMHRWRFIAVSSIVFALILGCIRYTKNLEALEMRAVENANQETAQGEELIESIKAELTEKELSEISDAVLKYKELLVKQQYLNASVYMNLNPYAKDVVTLSYYVDTGFVFNYTEDMEHDYANELIETYTSYIENQGILRGVREYQDWEIDDQYLGELITVGGRLANNGNATATTNSSGNMFVIFVTGESKEKAEELAAGIEKAINAYQMFLVEKIGSHSLILVDHYHSMVADDLLASERQALIGAIETCQTKLQSLTDTFSDNQKIIFLDEIQGGEEGYFTIDEVKPVQAEAEIVSTSFLLRDMLVGAIAGLALACIGIAVLYSINGKVKLNEELFDLYGLRVFGNLMVKDKKTKMFGWVDQWIYSLQYKKEGTLEEKKELTITNLQVTCKNENIKRIFFTSTFCLSENDKMIVNDIISKLGNSGIEAVYGECVNRNARSFERMVQIGHVILVEKEMVSLFVEIEKEIVFCREQNVNLLGVLGLHSNTI